MVKKNREVNGEVRRWMSMKMKEQIETALADRRVRQLRSEKIEQRERKRVK